MSITYRIRRHHKCNGNLGLHLDNPEIKWCLNVWIVPLTMRAWCRPGGGSCFWAPGERMEFFIPAEHLLSRMCRCGWIPRSVIYL